jgi:hypothetical protein
MYTAESIEISQFTVSNQVEMTGQLSDYTLKLEIPDGQVLGDHLTIEVTVPDEIDITDEFLCDDQQTIYTCARKGSKVI